LIETIAFTLSLKPSLDQYLAHNSHENVIYSYIKSVEIVAKSLLSRCLPYDTQD